MASGSRVRTITVLGVTLALVAAVVLAAGAASSPSLPPESPAGLLASTLEALDRRTPISGMVATHLDLGIPSPPSGTEPSDDPVTRLLGAVGGDHRVRVWRSPAGLRVAELLPAAELGVVMRRDDSTVEAWLWDSQTFTAVHAGPVAVERGRDQANPMELVDPLQLSRRLLEAAGPTTRISVGASERVAGRDTYRLVVEPRTDATLVGRIEVAVDAEHRLPLGVWVFARGSGSAALSAAFSAVSFDPVDPRVFSFTPPPGATVRELGGPAPGGPDRSLVAHGPAGRASAPSTGHVRLFGEGWTTVVAYRLSALPGARVDGPGRFEALLPYSGPLLSARLAQRGGGAWLLVGAVPQSRLASVDRELP